jgi:hypothetical protein
MPLADDVRNPTCSGMNSGSEAGFTPYRHRLASLLDAMTVG